MRTTEVISNLHQRGITLKVVAGRLKIGGAEKLTDREKAILRASKEALLKTLATKPMSPADPVSAPVAPSTAPTRPFSRANTNRRAMPIIAGVVDAFRRVFGANQVKVVFAEEGGQRLTAKPVTSREGRS